MPPSLVHTALIGLATVAAIVGLIIWVAFKIAAEERRQDEEAKRTERVGDAGEGPWSK